jgi:hypothetical protein
MEQFISTRNLLYLAIITVIIWVSSLNRKAILPTFSNEVALHLIVKSQENKIDRELLGRSTWYLLHSLASVNQKNSLYWKMILLDFIVSSSLLYPCQKCAPHFQKYLKNNPPLMENKDSFAMWLCRFHNSVNQRLGKPIFDCTSNSIIAPCATCGND